ncbi:MAG TPA: Ig-like domain-containing protein, partial [Nitrospiria bacterium]
MQVKKMWSSGLVVGLLFTALIGGCAKGDDGSISTSVDSPSAATFRPIGTIQGKVVDSTTRQPIVNAVVSIGLAADVTDAQGQYILANVPATSDALNNTVNGRYDMTVDLRAVVSPIDMRVATTTPRYPDFRYQDVSVSFTSLNDTDCDNINNGDSDGLDACENSSNHDTAVDGLVSNQDVQVGKLSANIQGVVAGCSVANGDFFTPVANATVNLISASIGIDGSNSSTGSGQVVATTTTDANGVFTFNNIEANQTFNIAAMDSATNPTRANDGNTGTPGIQPNYSLTSPPEGQTIVLSVQESSAVHICLLDNHSPEIIAVSPEPGSDLTAGATTVTLTFSEPIKQETASSTVPSTVGSNLYDNIVVNFDGNKAGNIPYTLAWNATFDQLTVGFTTGASALYVVKLPGVASLRDADLNGAVPGKCPTASISPWITTGVAGDCVVYFSTNGGTTVTAAPVLTLVNDASLDQAGSTTGILDWPPVSGAKTYNVYCTTFEHF